MRIKTLQMKKTAFAVLVGLLLLAVGEAQAQYYNYDPALGVYTEEGSTSEYVVMNKFNYSNCNFLSTTVNYYKGHVNTCLYSHNTSSGLMRFRVAKCDNNYYFGSGGAGKIIIVENNTTVVLCESYSISGSSTHYIEKSLYHDNFTDVCWFDVYLITSDLVNYYYAGRVIVRRAYAPAIISENVTNISTTSAQLTSLVNPQGLETTWYYQYGTSTSFGENTPELTISGGYDEEYADYMIAPLNPGTRYYYRLRAYNNAGSVVGETKYFTTEDNTSAPEVTTNNATNITAYSGTLNGTVNPKGLNTTAWFEYGTTTSLGTTSSTFYPGSGYIDYPIQYVLNNLQPNTRYYYRAFASNSKGQTQGTRKYFDTDAGGNPIVTTGNASSIGSTTATLNGTINPQGLNTNYYFRYGTTDSYELGQIGQGSLGPSTSVQSVSAPVTNLIPNTTYHYQLYASNNAGSQYGYDKSFKTEEDECYFIDCTSGEVHDAAQYLCERGVITGDAGAHTLRPNDYITRGELAKASFFGLYSNSSGVNIPPMVTDYFPCIYPDLQESSFYYQAAKALLYLEYYDASAQHLDGISPFDRDRSCFNPDGTITRRVVLKVLLETFNIKPATSGSNPFSDFPSDADFWGYAKKAHQLGIVVLDNGNTAFNPYQDCTRGEAILFLSRILHLIDNNTITKPVPNYDTYNPFTSDFFVPTNLSPEIVNSMRGAEYGNFNYYNKDFFKIPGYMNLDFGIEYNSYLTEMPDDFYPVKPMGKAWTHNYDMYMNVVQDNYNNISYLVFHMSGGSLLMYKEINGVQEKLTEGNYYTLTKSGSTYTLKSTGQISYTFTLKSDNVYHLTQIKDRNNNIITINYGTNGSNVRISSVTTQGRTLTFSYNSDNLLSSVKDPRNRMVYFYYTDGQLTSLKDAKSQTTAFSYGTLDFEKGLLKEITLPKGNKVYNGYQQRKLQSMSYSNGTTQVAHTNINITPNYENGSTVSTVTDNLSNSQSVTTTYTMNDKQRVTNVTDGVSTNVSFEYGLSGNESGLVTKKTDHKTGLQTTYAYDSRNGMTSSFTVSNGSESHTTSVVYNDYNDITQFTDANNNKTYYYYDNSNHNLVRVVNALGYSTYIDNNSHGVPIRVTNPMGFVVEYDYNTYGNLDEISIPSLNLTATIEYDNVSRVADRNDFAGHTTHYTYDDNDNLFTVINADGKTTTYHVDANDNLEWIQNAKGIKTNMTYDFNTDFMTQVEFQGHTRNYTYKRDGTLESFTDANGNTFNYTYNNAGELTSDGYADLSYYSTTGQIWKVTKDGKAITYTYDDFCRISSIAYDGKTVSYTYDNNGNVKTIVYPGSKTVTYTYDALNRITAVKDWNNKTTSYYYRNDGQLDYYQYPNGVRTTISYDDSGRCNGISTKRNSGNGSVIAEYSYDFDNMGNHTSETFTEPFEAYPSIPSENLTYNYNNDNRLTSVGDLSFTYDGNGNNTMRTGRTYNYDVKDNLISVSGDFVASYTYDGLGNRRSATRNGVTTKYVLNLLGNMPMVLMDTDANGTAQHYYIYGPSGLISRIDGSNNTRYYVYDFRGSTVAMTDATTTANVTHKYQYDDFGKLLQVEEEDENPYRYVGRFGVGYEDLVLTYMRARYYDSEIGRFLSEDPIWNTNLYPYADNNPIMLSDPQGKNPVAAYDVFAMTMGYFGTFATEVDIALYGIDLDSQTGVNNYAMTCASTTASVIGMILGTANPVGAVATCLSAGISIGQLIGDKYDEQITNGLASIMIAGNKAKNWVKNTYNNIISDIKAGASAAKQNRVERQEVIRRQEAWDWVFNSTDQHAKFLKKLYSRVANSDQSAAEKQKVYSDIYKMAREYMPK